MFFVSFFLGRRSSIAGMPDGRACGYRAIWLLPNCSQTAPKRLSNGSGGSRTAPERLPNGSRTAPALGQSVRVASAQVRRELAQAFFSGPPRPRPRQQKHCVVKVLNQLFRCQLCKQACRVPVNLAPERDDTAFFGCCINYYS